MGTTLLRILACAAVVVLIYEAWTLIGSVLLPLLGNPNALQTDFHYYYDAAARFSADGRSVYRLSDDVIAGFTYPPPAIVPFVLLAKLPLGIALVLLTIASYVVLLAATRRWIGHLKRHGAELDRASEVAVIVIAVAMAPTYMNAVFGQVNAFILAAAVFFVTAAEAAPIATGTALALGAWLKVYPALLAWTVCWDRRVWRAAACAAGAAVSIALLSLVLVPADAYRVFLFDVLPARGDKTAIHITNQSLIAFLERFRHEPAMFLNWTGEQAVTVSPIVRAVNFGGLGVALLLLLKLAHEPQRRAVAAAILMALIAMAAPLGWGHTYVMVLPLAVMNLVAIRRVSAPAALLIFGCVAAFMIPAGRHLPIDGAPAFIQNLLYSRYLLAGVVMVAISAVAAGPPAESSTVASA